MDNSHKVKHTNHEEERKLDRCLFLSMAIHGFLMFCLYILLLPPSGVPEVNFVNVSLDTGTARETTENEPDSSEPQEQDYQKEFDNINEDFAEEVLEDFSDEFQNLKKELKQRQTERQNWSKNTENIKKNLKQRSKYGPLRPRSFYGVDIFSQSIIFVVDISGSMDVREAIIQLKNAFESLEAGERFNIILYSNQAHAWRPQTVFATEKNKQEANTWLQRIKRGGGTNSYAALKKALTAARPSIDVIYFLSDGRPTSGAISNPQKLLQQVKAWNSSKNIEIHSIGLGANQDHFFLESLAAENGGVYHSR